MSNITIVYLFNSSLIVASYKLLILAVYRGILLGVS